MKNILIVEDNRLERGLLVYILNEAFGNKINIVQARDGDQALEILTKSTFDLVVTDLVMPKIEGIELIKKIKSQFNEKTNIIAVSGRNPFYLYLAKKMGINGVFTKPLDKEKFLSTVDHILKLSTFQTLLAS
jgi:YesN/AraC family two-component response regulator